MTASKGVCSPCLRGKHERCTLPDRCGCPADHDTDDQPTPAPAGRVHAVSHEDTAAASTAEGIVWREPPPIRPGGPTTGLTDAEQAALRSRPGQWARIRTWPGKTSGSTTAVRLRRHLDPAEWELRATAREPGVGSAVYARFVGTKP